MRVPGAAEALKKIRPRVKAGLDSPARIQSEVCWKSAPVAQLDRANASGALGRGFESLRAHHFPFSNSFIR